MPREAWLVPKAAQVAPSVVTTIVMLKHRDNTGQPGLVSWQGWTYVRTMGCTGMLDSKMCMGLPVSGQIIAFGLQWRPGTHLALLIHVGFNLLQMGYTNSLFQIGFSLVISKMLGHTEVGHCTKDRLWEELEAFVQGPMNKNPTLCTPPSDWALLWFHPELCYTGGLIRPWSYTILYSTRAPAKKSCVVPCNKFTYKKTEGGKKR